MTDEKKTGSETSIPEENKVDESWSNASETDKYPPPQTQPLERKNYNPQSNKKNE